MSNVEEDRKRWARLRARDASALRLLHAEHAARLQAFLRRYLGNDQAAEDVTQETFVQLWVRPNGFRPERGSLRAYLFGIGRRRAADWWRRQRPGCAPQGIGDTSPATAELETLMSDALRRLEPDARALLWLREVEGHSYAELATIFDVPLGTVRSRLFAARESLRKVWSGVNTGEEEVG